MRTNGKWIPLQRLDRGAMVWQPAIACLLRSRCCTSVVLPEPRKPEMTTAGTSARQRAASVMLGSD
eukprot:352550-Chlamydomonas_euryale.AAC.20